LYEPSPQTGESTGPEPLAAGFHALADPLRLQVLACLRTQELCVCELVALLGIAQSRLSFHLKTLKAAGLVRTRQEKRWTYYSLNLSALIALEQYLADYRRYSALLPSRGCNDLPRQ